MGQIYIGTSGYNYKDWKEKFYPKGLPASKWMDYYSKNFNTLEINATFYRSFKKEVFEKWALTTPSDFHFVIKGPRLISHYKKLVEVEEELDYFLGTVSGLKEKLSIVLWQFPKSFKCDVKNKEKLVDFFKILPINIKFAVELRDNSWFNQEIFDILDEFRIGFVINDTPAFDVTEKVTGEFGYIRFHGPSFLYTSSYSDSQMKDWVKKIKVIANTKDVFCFFNNDVSGYAIDNANTLKNFLGVK